MGPGMSGCNWGGGKLHASGACSEFDFDRVLQISNLPLPTRYTWGHCDLKRFFSEFDADRWAVSPPIRIFGARLIVNFQMQTELT